MDSKSILNSENYKNNFVESLNDILTEYIHILDKYNNTVLTSINIIKHDYFKYVYLKGVESLTYIFNFLLFYTKNLSLTCHHCEKALFYYIEFIGQIGDENHSFLQLNSKDAILFIYKKTIYEIDDSIKKNFEPTKEDNKVFDIIRLFTNIYKKITNIYINSNNINNLNEIPQRNNLYNLIFNNIKNVFENMLKKPINEDSYNDILKIVDCLLNKNYNLENNICNIIFILISKQYDKKNNKFNKILENINDNQFDENHTNDKFVKHYLIV